jgi:hypothetical protein
VALGESGTSAPLRKSALPPNDQHHVVGATVGVEQRRVGMASHSVPARCVKTKKSKESSAEPCPNGTAAR